MASSVWNKIKEDKVMDKTIEKTKNVTIPRWFFESMCADSDLVRWLSKCRGAYWIDAVRKEMELEEKYFRNKE